MIAVRRPCIDAGESKELFEAVLREHALQRRQAHLWRLHQTQVVMDFLLG